MVIVVGNYQAETTRVEDDCVSKNFSGVGKRGICQLIASAISVAEFLTPFSYLILVYLQLGPTVANDYERNYY